MNANSDSPLRALCHDHYVDALHGFRDNATTDVERDLADLCLDLLEVAGDDPRIVEYLSTRIRLALNALSEEGLPWI